MTLPQSLGEIINPAFDPVTFLTEYEQGILEDDAIVAGFQNLIDSGLILSLQGHYQRAAMRLIHSGECRMTAPRR